MADHGQPDIAGATATAQAETAHSEVAASPYGEVAASVEAPPVHHGRPISWIAVTIIIVGFVVGGAALILGTVWWLFWAGLGIAAFGGIIAMATGIFEDWY
jgi:hypothetical protein